MPKYRITSPDGQAFEVSAPDGATQDQVLEYAKSQWGKGAPAQEKKPVPFEDPGFGESMLIGAGRTFDRVGKGMQQLYYGATGQDDKAAELKSRADADNESYAPLQKARPWATGIGEALPSMVLPAGGSATMIGNAGRMALAGGIPGALEYGDVRERALRGATGAAAGAAVPIVGAAAKTAWSVAEPLFQKGREKIAGRVMNRVAGDNADQIAARMSSAAELVPGSAPTAAQVAESGGIAALERSASASNPEAYTQRAMEQASARLNALRGIAKDGVALDAAEAARDAVAKPLYNQAKGAVMESTPELAAALGKLPPDVMTKAQRLATMEGRPLKIGKDIPASMQPTGVLDANGQMIMQNIPAQKAKYSGAALHYIKLALDDSLGKSGDGSLGSVEKRMMTGAKDDLLQAIDAGIPAYGQARQEFARLSRPVNQMQIGQELLQKLQPALSDYGALGQESAATFGRALRDADATAAKATGFKGATIASVMEPNQLQALDAIGADLARKSNAQNLGRGVGSDTFQKLSMQNLAEQSGMPRVVGGLLELPGVSRATAWAYRDTDEKMQALLADALLDPKRAAELMTRANKRWMGDHPQVRRALEQAAVRGGGLLGLASTQALSQPSQ